MIKDEKIYAVYSSASEIYVAGFTESINATIKGRQGWLLVLSQNGDSIWSHDYGIIGVSDELHDIIALNNDYLLLVGTTQSLIEAGKTDVFIFIIRKSTRGIENFVTLFKTGKEKGIKALRAPTGEIFILGTSQISDNKNNIYIWKISEDLSVIQEKQISATISETPSDIIYENGSLIIIGTAFNEQSNEDILVYALDNNFNILSRNTFGSRDNQKGISGVISNRNVIIGGSVYSKGTSKASLFKTPEILP
ncbi:MAG: hypothetical protein HC905_19150 [Bacteroidales bacterium]|nr:hypothetical protein [Bacteroidales bacterium]